MDNSLYTGITTDVIRRFAEHTQKNKLGAKYTRSRKPVTIEAVWQCDNRADASKLEYNFKKLSKAVKEQILCDAADFKRILSPKLNTELYTSLEEYSTKKHIGF